MEMNIKMEYFDKNKNEYLLDSIKDFVKEYLIETTLDSLRPQLNNIINYLNETFLNNIVRETSAHTIDRHLELTNVFNEYNITQGIEKVIKARGADLAFVYTSESNYNKDNLVITIKIEKPTYIITEIFKRVHYTIHEYIDYHDLTNEAAKERRGTWSFRTALSLSNYLNESPELLEYVNQYFNETEEELINDVLDEYSDFILDINIE